MTKRHSNRSFAAMCAWCIQYTCEAHVLHLQREPHTQINKRQKQKKRKCTRRTFIIFIFQFHLQQHFFQLIFLCKAAMKKWPEKIANKINKTNEKNRVFSRPRPAAHSHYIFLFLPPIFSLFHYKCVAGIRKNIIREKWNKTYLADANEKNSIAHNSVIDFPPGNTCDGCTSSVIRIHAEKSRGRAGLGELIEWWLTSKGKQLS